MEDIPKNLPREVRRRPYSTESTKRIIGRDPEDAVLEDSDIFFENLKSALLEHGLDIKKKIKVLEVGSGDARFLNYMKNQGLDAVGIDSRPRGESNSQVLGRIEQLPFKDGQFDLVVSFGSVFDNFQYIQDQNLMLKEIHRVLKAGGFYYGSGFKVIKAEPIIGFDLVTSPKNTFNYIYKRT